MLTTEWVHGESPKQLAERATGTAEGRYPLATSSGGPVRLQPMVSPYAAAGGLDTVAQVAFVPVGEAERELARERLLHMVDLGVRSSLTQLLETGIMHADPHPGELA